MINVIDNQGDIIANFNGFCNLFLGILKEYIKLNMSIKIVSESFKGNIELQYSESDANGVVLPIFKGNELDKDGENIMDYIKHEILVKSDF